MCKINQQNKLSRSLRRNRIAVYNYNFEQHELRPTHTLGPVSCRPAQIWTSCEYIRVCNVAVTPIERCSIAPLPLPSPYPAALQAEICDADVADAAWDSAGTQLWVRRRRLQHGIQKYSLESMVQVSDGTVIIFFLTHACNPLATWSAMKLTCPPPFVVAMALTNLNSSGEIGWSLECWNAYW